MKWYYRVLGGHTHVRVFMNGAKCGDLCFRNEEFLAIHEEMETLANAAVDGDSARSWMPLITFIEEGETQSGGCEATHVSPSISQRIAAAKELGWKAVFHGALEDGDDDYTALENPEGIDMTTEWGDLSLEELFENHPELLP